MFCCAYKHRAHRCKYQGTVFPHSCKDQYAAWTQAKFCKTGFERCLFLLLFLRLICRGSDFACSSGDPQCVMVLLCSPWQRWLLKLLLLPSRCSVLSQPVSAERAEPQGSHRCVRADPTRAVTNVQPGAEACQKCLMLV